MFSKGVYILTWVALIATILSFFGVFSSGGFEEQATEFAIGLLLPIPDFGTIILAVVTIALGLLSGFLAGSGRGLAIAGAVCIVISFTPIATGARLIGLSVTKAREGFSELTASEYVGLSEGDYKMFAYLGSSSAKPEDHDIFDYTISGYDGHAEKEYKKYRVCGYIFPADDDEDWDHWQTIVVEVVLTDADGNDILVDGSPVKLTGKAKGGMAPTFETDVINAKDLPKQPCNFRVERVLLSVYTN